MRIKQRKIAEGKVRTTGRTRLEDRGSVGQIKADIRRRTKGRTNGQRKKYKQAKKQRQKKSNGMTSGKDKRKWAY